MAARHHSFLYIRMISLPCILAQLRTSWAYLTNLQDSCVRLKDGGHSLYWHSVGPLAYVRFLDFNCSWNTSWVSRNNRPSSTWILWTELFYKNMDSLVISKQYSSYRTQVFGRWHHYDPLHHTSGTWYQNCSKSACIQTCGIWNTAPDS